ncbi:Serotonin N-acetyltransferase 1, chloroplastic, partial [Cucurbita argyrosperma subsp. argyrosperma]
MVAALYSTQKSPASDENAQKKLIGMARATSDHAFNATIWDVLVDPSYQIDALKNNQVTWKTGIWGCIKMVEFYQNLGFQPDPEGIKGMFWYPRH